VLCATKAHSNSVTTKKPVKILYVSQYFQPEMGAPAARVAELSRYWARGGHEVTVLTGFPNHPTGVVPLEYRSKFRRMIGCEDSEGVKVVRTWLLPLPNRKPYERMLNYSSFCLSAGTTGLFLRRPDVIIASSPQLLVGLSGWWIARNKSVPFIFEVRDLWPECLAAVGVGSEASLLHRSLRKIADFLYRHAERVVVVTPAFREYLAEHQRVPREKLSVIENGVETDLFSPQKRNPDVRTELEADGKFIVSYIGTMGMAHGLETLVEAAAQLQSVAPEVLFLVVGEGADKQRVIDLVRLRRLTNVQFLGRQPREKIPAYICASDACLVLLKKSDIFKTVIPTKLLEFMSCARPVILGVDGQAREIVEQAHAGIFIEPGNAADLARAVIALLSNSRLRESVGGNGRRYVVQNYSRQQTARAYIELLENVVGKRVRHCAAGV
jgi:colanic acid biosynthesis glycosyl transferase WcaI